MIDNQMSMRTAVTYISNITSLENTETSVSGLKSEDQIS